MSSEQLIFLVAVLALSLALVLARAVPRLRRWSMTARGTARGGDPRPVAPRVEARRSGMAAAPERAGAGGRGRASEAPSEAPSAPAGHAAPAGPAGPAAHGSAAARGRACPACQRQYPMAFQFCPVDARPLGDAGRTAAAPAPALKRLRCGACHRQFLADDGARFCPFDGQRLQSGRDHRRSGGAVRVTRSPSPEVDPGAVHASAASARAVPDPPAGIFSVGPPPAPAGNVPTQICPTCSERIHTGARQCPHDGAELVSLN